MEKPTSPSFPKTILVIIVLILGSMYYYATYVDSPEPERTVKEFYQAYFSRDFESVSQNLSVFWSVRLLPQYANLSPVQLLEKRDSIEKDTSQTIAEMESQNQLPENISIDIMPEYTQEGTNSAIVVYSFQENGKPSGMELAILIMEKGRFRIFALTPVAPQDLPQIKQESIKELDDSFKNLLSSS